MNRLTEVINDVAYLKWNSEYKNSPCWDCGYNNIECSECEQSGCSYSVVLDKLAAYEDTGFEPEQVKQLNDAFTNSQKKLEKAFDDLLEYKKLEKQGLLIKLPCKLGTKLFIIQTELLADGKNTRREKCIIESEFTDWNILHVVDNWGKTVFLTREEAEKALEENKNE